MPRYFLHLREGDNLLEDPDGHEFRDVESAHDEALAEARDILAEYVRAGKLLIGQQFDITDENGRVLMVVPLGNALNLPH